MLVLSRHIDESIIIGNNIVVTIVDIRGDKVRLGIDCPLEIPVHRREVYEAIQRENLRASENEYSSFKKNLIEGNFESAYDVFYRNQGEFGSREEIDRMV